MKRPRYKICSVAVEDGWYSGKHYLEGTEGIAYITQELDENWVACVFCFDVIPEWLKNGGHPSDTEIHINFCKVLLEKVED